MNSESDSRSRFVAELLLRIGLGTLRVVVVVLPVAVLLLLVVLDDAARARPVACTRSRSTSARCAARRLVVGFRMRRLVVAGDTITLRNRAARSGRPDRHALTAPRAARRRPPNRRVSVWDLRFVAVTRRNWTIEEHEIDSTLPSTGAELTASIIRKLMSNCLPVGTAASSRNKSSRPMPRSSVVIACGTSPLPSVTSHSPRTRSCHPALCPPRVEAGRRGSAPGRAPVRRGSRSPRRKADDVVDRSSKRRRPSGLKKAR